MSRSPLRIPIPKTTAELLSLAATIHSKHVADGAATLIPPHLGAQLTQLYTEANQLHNQQQQLYRDTEKLTQQRNLVLGIDHTQDSRTPNTVIFYIASVRNYLLGVYAGQEKKLGNWGFTVNAPYGKPSIPLPLKPQQITELGNKIWQKHLADGAASPIPPILLNGFEPLLNQATTLVTQSAQMLKDAESATQTRNKLLGLGKGKTRRTEGTLLHVVVCVRNILLGYFRGQEKSLGLWGFTVITSRHTPAQPNP
ncbi:MAG TPA: hypothetical protein PK239_18985 [Chitinophagales bacterium]|nr:hypothetical protein [Chitinophagales bacterium]HRK29370.1 hypothetical protein [Chitinophagales bacterium]